MEQNNRIGSLDFFRIFSIFVVFLFHCSMHLGCNYGFLQPFITMGAVFMTGFFILSGFCIYITYENRDLCDIRNIKLFYKKRIINIMPMYYITAILFILLFERENLLENLVVASIELLGLQSVFDKLFLISHNGGTWFISCLIICYTIYPFIQETIKKIDSKYKKIIFLLFSFISVYSPIVVIYFNLDQIYSNPFFRVLEFTIGVLLASFSKNVKKTSIFHKYFINSLSIILQLFFLIYIILLLVKRNIYVNNYMMYNIFCLPMFCLIILSLSKINLKILRNKVLEYISKLSYTFFLSQFFVWSLTRHIFEIFNIEINVHKIIIVLFIWLLISFLLHEAIEKPVKMILSKIIL